ncbi:chromosome segregation protein SMC [Legionella nagasakiensis]|uniref:chromosome segregation protein SMC n=1 Tax=Legionella nagasakiensis TaxID=535290 RepID=UPI00105571FD|nr:chromosome segregation protein SMC [Legionella nagasakiensis]
MHLKQLKMAGFKSFVEPTIIPFPSQLVAVVGPNGCGKSNIIDAVRWVMGESSAKNLRGESMTDVIFNGSSHRKPVGQASVELIFDNSLGRLTGQYASYQEIAVKRLVTRDGDSFYYLNSSRCRRKDIQDVFLGTGAGARGYAIIGQDMITRLIEARPEELRVYLEEAAGISKYKERRRETLQRIRFTRENLGRVEDIRAELGKQLARLERQAKAAERFKALKEKERLFKAEVLAMKWRSLSHEQAQMQKDINQLTLQFEEYQSKYSGLKKEELLTQEKLHEANHDLQQIQMQVYQLNHEIARLEEFIQQKQRDKQRLFEEKQQIHSDLQLAINQQKQGKETLQTDSESLHLLETQLQTLQAAFAVSQNALKEWQKQEEHWRSQWQQARVEQVTVQQKMEIEKVRLQHIEQRRQQALLRLEKIKNELSFFDIDALKNKLLTKEAKQAHLLKEQQEIIEAHQKAINESTVLRQQIITTEQQLRQTASQVQSLSTEHAALLAAQNSALKTMNESLERPQWKNAPRLVEVMKVSDTWLPACELVLGDGLHAVLLDSVASIQNVLPDLRGTASIFVTLAEKNKKRTVYPRLADMIEGSIPCWHSMLEHVFAADTLDEALQWLPSLNANQSIVTADGYWLGLGWVRTTNCSRENKDGLLRRKQLLGELSHALINTQSDLKQLQDKQDAMHVQLNETQKTEEDLSRLLSEKRNELRFGDTEIHKHQQSMEQALIRTTMLTEEIEELEHLIATLAEEWLQSDGEWQTASQSCKHCEQQQKQLDLEKKEWENGLFKCWQEVEKIKASLREVEMQCEKKKLKIQQTHENLQRETQRISTLQERLDIVSVRGLEMDSSNDDHKSSLEQAIIQHNECNTQLMVCRQQVEELQAKSNHLVQDSKSLEQQIKSIQEIMQQQHIKAQGFSIRTSSILESLAELNMDAECLLNNVPSGLTSEEREKELLYVSEQLNRLGAVNLIAIDEYKTELQRKQYLDEQHQDLVDALTTLELAIAKMDKDTQQRLQETFEQINASFQSLFPRLFGGGRAILQWTCDNLLEAGILIMAQPPGKRNSTIHMLSGGEKAMTAVALIFAIFQLNPAPFCMLDEVDAPLDDVNVRRFCELVKEMSQWVQFLFITHNKNTMELADHLIGVTMREPGVSRIVSVDVEQALFMNRS